jgi:acylphosphatase
LDPVVRSFRIVGKVQGVFFRHSARIEAERLGLRGFVRNLADGSVEVVAQGAAAALDELHRWLHRGPARARVDVVHELAPQQAPRTELPASFEVR